MAWRLLVLGWIVNSLQRTVLPVAVCGISPRTTTRPSATPCMLPAPRAPPDPATIRTALAARSMVFFVHGNAACTTTRLPREPPRQHARDRLPRLRRLERRPVQGRPHAQRPRSVERGRRNVLVVKNSLETAVAAGLVRKLELEHEGVASSGLVLLATFKSVDALMDTYVVFAARAAADPAVCGRCVSSRAVIPARTHESQLTGHSAGLFKGLLRPTLTCSRISW